jgi:hypothetical protein
MKQLKGGSNIILSGYPSFFLKYGFTYIIGFIPVNRKMK